MDLQRRLAAAGFSAGVADGIFGAATETAVKNFQRSRGLAVDGIVGPQVWRALGVGTTKPGGPSASSSSVSLPQLQAIMPHLPEARARECLPPLNQAMAEKDINTPLRQAAFLAQVAHESAELQFFEEQASGAAYEGRQDLGNTQPGDGVRYKGRGPIQLTGRANYRAAGLALGLDLEGNPKRAADVDVGFRTAAWFWDSHDLNHFADLRDFDTITRRINGGLNGKASRDAYYALALQVLSR